MQRVRVKTPGHTQAVVALITCNGPASFRAEDAVDLRYRDSRGALRRVLVDAGRGFSSEAEGAATIDRHIAAAGDLIGDDRDELAFMIAERAPDGALEGEDADEKIGRASCRERVWTVV